MAQATTKQPNCVRVSHIIKNVGRENVARHIDYLLDQAASTIGPVAYCYIYKHANTENENENDTLGHIMLKNPQYHKQLAFMLNGFNFHGKTLLAALSYHHFSSIDDDYYPRPVQRECNYSRKFESFVIGKEDDIKQQAIELSIQNVRVHQPSSKILDEIKKKAFPTNEFAVQHQPASKQSICGVSSNFKQLGLGRGLGKLKATTSTIGSTSSIAVVKDMQDEEFEWIGGSKSELV